MELPEFSSAQNVEQTGDKRKGNAHFGKGGDIDFSCPVYQDAGGSAIKHLQGIAADDHPGREQQIHRRQAGLLAHGDKNGQDGRTHHRGPDEKDMEKLAKDDYRSQQYDGAELIQAQQGKTAFCNPGSGPGLHQ